MGEAASSLVRSGSQEEDQDPENEDESESVNEPLTGGGFNGPALRNGSVLNKGSSRQEITISPTTSPAKSPADQKNRLKVQKFGE